MKLIHTIAASLITFACVKGADINDLNSRADLVVVGVTSGYTADRQQVSFDLNVERVLRGDIQVSSVHVSHKWGSKFAGGAYVHNGPVRGIWFLSRLTGAGWDVVPAHGDSSITELFFPAAPTVLPVQYQYDANTNTIDALVLEIAAGIESDGSRPELILGAVTSVNSAVLERALSMFLASPNQSFQVIGLSGLLEHNVRNSVSELVRLWPAISENPFRQYVLSALRDFFRDTDPNEVGQLAAAAVDGTTAPEVKQAAVVALAAIHTKDSLPFLAGLLNSQNSEERMKGVYGISSFVNGCPPQTRDNIKSMQYLQFVNPSPYRTTETMARFTSGRGSPDQQAALVVFWQQWWNKHPELH